jgi:hypothetical protein
MGMSSPLVRDTRTGLKLGEREFGGKQKNQGEPILCLTKRGVSTGFGELRGKISLFEKSLLEFPAPTVIISLV